MDDASSSRAGAQAARLSAIWLSIMLAIAAAMLFLQYGSADGVDAMDFVRGALIFGSTFWLAWGASQSLLGLLYRDRNLPRLDDDAPIVGRTAVLIPIYNEDPVAAFARAAAMDASLAATGLGAQFDFAILSDTSDQDIALREERCFQRLLKERNGRGRMFYRRRKSNIGKKAGNLEDFFRHSGGAYEYALILDADSLMEGETIVELVRRMEADPELGLLQTLPKIINARSLFGRAQQFAASFYSPVFARGQAMMQGGTGPFWGHNALVRVRAFAFSAGLPVLSGEPPFGGHILSHDYVEAALLARAGWIVRLDPDMSGSYEEAPEDIVSYAKRDRRWCQGNLQHTRLLTSPGLQLWSRWVFLQGILSYVTPLFWGLFLLASIAAPLFSPELEYFPERDQLFPVFPTDQTSKAIGLAVGIFGLLILPKLLITVRANLTGRAQAFGGPARSALSMLSELALTSVVAPVMLMYQTRSVFQVLLGIDAGWPASQREGQRLTLRQAWAACHWIVLSGLIGLTATWYLAQMLFIWLLPVGLPMILSPLLVSWSSRTMADDSRLFEVPSELSPSPVIVASRRMLAEWRAATVEPKPSAEQVRDAEAFA